MHAMDFRTRKCRPTLSFLLSFNSTPDADFAQKRGWGARLGDGVRCSKCLWVFGIFGLHLFQPVSLCRFIDGEERTYGGCEGPDAMYVKLISSDGHEFIVKREHALTSGTIKAMLSGPGESSFQDSTL